MNSTRLRHLLLLVLLLFTARLGWSQGATTAAMSGTIADKAGAGLPGATVIAIHTPTNTQYVVPTNTEGRFNIQNMRVGGPYTVKVTFVGYQDVTRSGISLTLAENYRLDAKLSDAATALTEVVVTGRQNPVINADRTGAATTVQREQIERLPTINRSFDDFTRLTPQANGQSFGGRNSGYNNITIDGALFNNAFGLSSTVGGQANAQPISLDAIDQIQVSIAPYDVRQGSFTGAGINAVTRSGTNRFSGSVYGFYRDQALVSSKVGSVDSDFPTFKLKNYGFRVGGPIIKDKLFFFLNGEEETRTDPPSGNFIANRPGVASPGVGSQTSAVSARDLTNLSNFLATRYGYQTGGFENYSLPTFSRKATAKLDWNISSNHRASVKYNYLRSFRSVAPSNSGALGGSSGVRSQSNVGLPFESAYYTINNNLNSVIGEVNSTFGNRFANNLTAGYSAFRDSRDAGSSLFPLVDIGNNTQATSATTGNPTNAITTFGFEPFTAFNVLNTDVYQVGDNFTAFLGKHNLTVGTYNEFYKFKNGFAPNYYGAYQFNSLEDFYSSAGYAFDRTTGNITATPNAPRAAPARFQQQYAANPGAGFPFAEISAAQYGLYVQDEYSPRQNLKVTIGLRADLPVVTSDLAQNTDAAKLTFRNGEKINTGQLPKTAVLFSPRVGFNWDVNDDKKTQLRGGTGIFTGRVPYVWISNQASNNGLLFGSIDTRFSSRNIFNDSVDAYRPRRPGTITSYNLAVTAEDFKFPQVWRTNLAIDHELPGGVVATLEALYTKDVNAVYHENVNLPNATLRAAGADNRPIYYFTNSNGVVVNTSGSRTSTAGIYSPATLANNRIYGAAVDANGREILNGSAATATGPLAPTAGTPNISDAIVMRNTNKGYSYSVTGQLQKAFSNGLFLSAAYTYSDSRSVNDGGSIAQSIWRDRSVSGDPNANVLSYSQFLQQHRVIGSLSYRRNFVGHLATTVSMFYEAAPAGRFSYTYSGDMNGDGQSNDLMYVPRTQSEIVLRDLTFFANTPQVQVYTAAQQWADLNNYIEQDDYLSRNRGSYAERNGAVRPWQNRLDVRLLQDLFTNMGENKNTLQLSIDIFNVGNLLNSDWGVFQTANRANPLAFAGYDSQNRPNFTFNYLNNPVRTVNGPDVTITPATTLTDTFRKDLGGLSSRWQAQIGVRYIFN